jgi:DNA repair photolyase
MFNPTPIILKKKNNKDKGQRELCGCINSKDIGQYNTCPHECVYCYANTSKDVARYNYNTHKANPNSDTIIGI